MVSLYSFYSYIELFNSMYEFRLPLQGLGLYMTRKIIEEHFKGSIEVNNDANGAHLTIILPTLK